MKKRRITLNLDEDIVTVLEGLGDRSVSAAANRLLREAVAGEARRMATLAWLDDLDAEHGKATTEEVRKIDHMVEEIFGAGSTSGVA